MPFFFLRCSGTCGQNLAQLGKTSAVCIVNNVKVMTLWKAIYLETQTNRANLCQTRGCGKRQHMRTQTADLYRVNFLSDLGTDEVE